MQAVIVGGGHPPSKKILDKYINEESIIIAADGGANVLLNHEIHPNYLLGDFDSIDEKTYIEISNSSKTIRFPKEKDYTDSHIAFNKAVELGATEIIFLGCTGKRIDHFYANLCILNEGLKKSIDCRIIDEYNEIYLIDKPTNIFGKKGDIFSLFSYLEDTHDLTIEGVKYKLKNFELAQGNNLTVSNEFEEEKVSITFSKGCLIVVRIHKI